MKLRGHNIRPVGADDNIADGNLVAVDNWKHPQAELTESLHSSAAGHSVLAVDRLQNSQIFLKVHR